MKNIFIFLVLLLMCSCGQKFSVVRLDAPVTLDAGGNKYVSILDRNADGELTAVVGEEMFRVYRYAVLAQNSVNYDAPTTRRFPASAVWSGTHQYNDGNSGDLVIYTTLSYCRGTIGVILDAQGNPATNKPVIQISGRKIGRRWPLNGEGKFFSPSKKISSDNKELVDYWMLRYQGMRRGVYSFDLCAKGDDALKVEQTVTANEKKFLEGFSVKGILVRGVKKEDSGKIAYRIIDQRGEIVPQEFLTMSHGKEKERPSRAKHADVVREKVPQPVAFEPIVQSVPVAETPVIIEPSVPSRTQAVFDFSASDPDVKTDVIDNNAPLG